MKQKSFVLSLILLISISVSLFGAGYLLIPMGDFFYDPILSRMKPSFTPEGGIVTDVFEANRIEIQLDGPVPKRVVAKLIGTSIDGWTEPQKAEARAFSRQHLLGKPVSLSYDWNPKDENGDLLVYLWNKVRITGKEIDVLWNAVLLVNGYAKICEEPFKNEFQAIFHDVSSIARKEKLGLFKETPTDMPTEWTLLSEEAKQQLFRYVYDQLMGEEKTDLEWVFATSFSHTGLAGRLLPTEIRTVTIPIGSIESYREYSFRSEEPEWKIIWEVHVVTGGEVIDPQAFRIKVFDGSGWEQTILMVDSNIKNLSSGERVIRRSGTFTIWVEGPNPYILDIYRRNPNF